MSNQPETVPCDAADDGRSYIYVRRRDAANRRDLSPTLKAIGVTAPIKTPLQPGPGSIDAEIRRYLGQEAPAAAADEDSSGEFEATPTVRLERPAALALEPGRTPTLKLFGLALGQLAETDEPAELTFGPAALDPLEPVSPTAPTVDLEPGVIAAALDAAGLSPRKTAYHDPQLCSCAEMVKATCGREIIDVTVGGPILFRTTLNVEDSAALCDDPHGLATRLTAIRCCPFDGTLMDAQVPEREQGVVGSDGSPYCCAWSREAHETGRLSLVTEKRRDMAAWSRFNGSPADIWHCPNCATKLMVLNHRRAMFYGHR